MRPLQVIDPVCGRHTAVLKSSKVLLKLSNGPEEPEVMIVPRHKKFEGAGKKATTKTKVRHGCQLLHLAFLRLDCRILAPPPTPSPLRPTQCRPLLTLCCAYVDIPKSAVIVTTTALLRCLLYVYVTHCFNMVHGSIAIIAADQ